MRMFFSALILPARLLKKAHKFKNIEKKQGRPGKPGRPFVVALLRINCG
jgi:hypothetical protein